jgi:hypothetical protein
MGKLVRLKGLTLSANFLYLFAREYSKLVNHPSLLPFLYPRKGGIFYPNALAYARRAAFSVLPAHMLA